ncbi:hypothetical protein GQ457_11G002360 [Hibiscus cannabinus]
MKETGEREINNEQVNNRRIHIQRTELRTNNKQKTRQTKHHKRRWNNNSQKRGRVKSVKEWGRNTPTQLPLLSMHVDSDGAENEDTGGNAGRDTIQDIVEDL